MVQTRSGAQPLIVMAAVPFGVSDGHGGETLRDQETEHDHEGPPNWVASWVSS